MNHLGLFEGIGGFSLAARWAGWHTVAWCEINPFGQQVLRHHFPKAKGHDDITKTDFTIYRGTVDIITGGFPCQPYSLAGKRLGKEDERHLWPEMLRAIREVAPRWVVGENVAGLVNWSDGLVFEEVQTELEAEGYEVLAFVLPAAGVGAPHRRDRVWFVAYASGERRKTRESHSNWQNSAKNKTRLDSRPKRYGDIRVIANSDNKRLQRSKEQGGAAGIRQESHQQPAGCVCTAWDEFPTQSPVCSRDDGFSARLDGITFSKWRSESVKAYGNAIVPQVALQIFNSINQFENELAKFPR